MGWADRGKNRRYAPWALSTSSSAPCFRTLEDLDSLLSSFRKTKMVIAHPESPWGISAMYQFAVKHDNMLLDLSGSGLFRMGMLRKGVDVMGSERILFGTDYPICNPAMNVAGVLFENLTEKEKKHILHDNFLLKCKGKCLRATKNRIPARRGYTTILHM